MTANKIPIVNLLYSFFLFTNNLNCNSDIYIIPNNTILVHITNLKTFIQNSFIENSIAINMHCNLYKVTLLTI